MKFSIVEPDELAYISTSNPPECLDTCEFKEELLDTPVEQFQEVEESEPEAVIDKFFKEDLNKIKNLELKEQIEELEKEKQALDNKINHLYSQIFMSISDDVHFNTEVLTKISNLLKHNTLEELQKFYGSKEK